MPPFRARHPRDEASAHLGRGRVGLVLEPSPPAVQDRPWFADDPVDPDGVEGVVVSPVGPDQGWEELVVGDADLALFARDHSLVGPPSLPGPPSSLPTTRTSLTALAFYVLAPVRQAANGKIGLRWTKGGFGTPFFGDDRQVRVEADHLVVQERDTVRAEPISTLRAAGDLVGIVPHAPTGIEFHDAPSPVDPDEALDVDPDAVGFLDRWFGFSTLVLERLRHDAGSPDDARVQLWPEHFDPALELGDADAGTRASYGASPGDASSPLPYLYVSPWTAQSGAFWSAPFGGAALGLDELRRSSDPVGVALEFFGRGRHLLGLRPG